MRSGEVRKLFVSACRQAGLRMTLNLIVLLYVFLFKAKSIPNSYRDSDFINIRRPFGFTY
ncbi:hypothetical protein, partial [Maribacter dokdonensis]|uniref:hypothetical protein n=1 Tax=Maribacter dokdonensis TaxID=320912 RepID=UPI003296A3A8